MYSILNPTKFAVVAKRGTSHVIIQPGQRLMLKDVSNINDLSECIVFFNGARLNIAGSKKVEKENDVVQKTEESVEVKVEKVEEEKLEKPVENNISETRDERHVVEEPVVVKKRRGRPKKNA